MAAALALGAAGCGGDDEPKAPKQSTAGKSTQETDKHAASTGDTSKQPARKGPPISNLRVNKACAQNRRGGPLEPPAGPADLRRYSREARVTTLRTLTVLKAVGARTKKREAVAALTTFQEALADLYERGAVADRRQAEQLLRFVEASERAAGRQANNAGLPACGPPSS